MPGWRVHRFLDRTFFGKVYYKVHRDMDSAVPFFGKRHRIFFHDPVWACIIARQNYPNDPDAIRSANLHILFDRICSSDPGLKKRLEYLEVLDRRKRKKKKGKQPKMDDALARFLGDLKKFEEARRLIKYFYSL